MSKNISSFNPQSRFSNRVEAYLKYRPHYPPEIISYLIESIGLKKDGIIADVGCGTGFLSELFLGHGNTVFGVEPNKEMREAGEGYLSRYPNFRSIAGSAESTLLNDHSVDIVTAAQAFHWFEWDLFRQECRRILRGKSIVCLIWNERDFKSTTFLREYEALLNRYSKEYHEIRHDNITDADLKTFFEETEYHSVQFPYFQKLDFERLKGRLLSASYVPLEGETNHGEMIGALQDIFKANCQNDTVDLVYETKIHWAKFS